VVCIQLLFNIVRLLSKKKINFNSQICPYHKMKIENRSDSHIVFFAWLAQPECESTVVRESMIVDPRRMNLVWLLNSQALFIYLMNCIFSTSKQSFLLTNKLVNNIF